MKTIFADLLVRVSSPFWIKQNHSNPICCYSKCLYMSIYTLPSYIEPTWGNRKHYGASILTKRATKASLLNLREFSLLFLSQSYRLCTHISYEYILKKIGLSLLLNKNYSLRLYIFNIFSSHCAAVKCDKLQPRMLITISIIFALIFAHFTLAYNNDLNRYLLQRIFISQVHLKRAWHPAHRYAFLSISCKRHSSSFAWFDFGFIYFITASTRTVG